MYADDINYTVVFENSGEETRINLLSLIEDLIDFLEHYGEASLVGETFYGIIGGGSGESKFSKLLKSAGFENNAEGFCIALIRQLERADSQKPRPVQIDGVVLPHLMVVVALEKLIPGNKFTSVRDIDQLEKLTNTKISKDQRSDLQKVLEIYPVRLSTHTIRQMRVSRAVSYQYFPFVEELDPAGHINTWIGQFHQGLLEQMYQNRVIFLLNMSCPVYCRFCFRKHKESRNEVNPTIADVQKAVEHIKQTSSIKEIVITGGDPFLNRANMACAIDGLMKIDHVQTLRLATRSIAYYPHLFYAENSALLKYLKAKNLQLQQRNKRMEIATHFIHPDEISPESLDIITEFVNNGVAVYVQTPFLKDCNDEGPELTRLFSLLRGAGAELHYIYIPCSPIRGNSLYWTPISKGIEVASYLRAHLSDRIIPRICTATAIGKIDWHTSGWAVDRDQENEHFFWIRTPYTPDYFKVFAPLAEEPDIFRVNEEGTIDIRYMAKIGDESLFLGSREPVAVKSRTPDLKALTKVQAAVMDDQRIAQSIVNTGSATLFRPHATRVEMDPDGDDRDLVYIEKHKAISDVILASQRDALDNLYRIGQIIQKLEVIPNVNAVRLRSLKFNYAPQRYSRPVLDRLGNLNRLTVVNPLRLEIETQFMHADEIHPEHAVLATALRNKGITVYNNTPLLTGINDTPDEVNRIAYRLREIGVEFHHLYVAGLSVQNTLNEDHPVDVSDVIEIATRVRRDGSGREIPRYIIRTEVGETDFGMTSRLIRRNGKLWVRLSPYDLAYYRAMEAKFTWPAGVEADPDGKPLVAVNGLQSSFDFLVY